MSSADTRDADTGDAGAGDAFERRIEQAARELRNPAPDVFQRAKAAARDVDASLDAAARSVAARAPAAALDTIRAGLADPDLALDAAARASAPTHARSFREVLELALAPDSQRRRVRRGRLIVLRAALVAAAATILAALLLTKGRPHSLQVAGPSLLTAAERARAEQLERQLTHEGDDLARRVANETGAVGSDDGRALMEEVAFLDAAIAECRDALAANELHPQIRQQLSDLARQRVELLRRVDRLPTPTPANGGGRG